MCKPEPYKGKGIHFSGGDNMISLHSDCVTCFHSHLWLVSVVGGACCLGEVFCIICHWQALIKWGEIRVFALENKSESDTSRGSKRDRENVWVQQVNWSEWKQANWFMSWWLSFAGPGESLSVSQYRQILICFLWQHFCLMHQQKPAVLVT